MPPDPSEVLADALGRVISDQRKLWARERAQFDAEARVTIAELRAQIAELKAESTALTFALQEQASEFRKTMQEVVDCELTQLHIAMAEVKDGRDGLDGEKGEPGRDADPDLIKQLVEERFAALPKPVDGRDGRDGIDGLPGERGFQGEPGPRGDAGLNGADADLLLIQRMVDEAVATLPVPQDGQPGKDGADGKDADPGMIQRMVEAAVAELPPPQDGRPGEPGEQGLPGERGEPGVQGERGLPGEQGLPGERGERGEPGFGLAGERGLPGEQGLPGERGEKGDPGPQGEPGLEGMIGKDGQDGLGVTDAFLDRSGALIVTMSNGMTKSLGIVVGQDGEPGLDGKPGLDGISFADFDFDLSYDGERRLEATWSNQGKQLSRQLLIPTLLDRGVYKEGVNYEWNDAVSYGGSLWIAQKATTEKPGTNGDWRLAVKHGRDGRDGRIGERGEKGEPGAPGRDWTAHGGPAELLR